MIRKVFIVFVCFLLIFPRFGGNVHAYSAVSFCLFDPITGRVLAERNMHRRMPMASTTKIMTALLVIELVDVEQIVTVTRPMITVEGSSIGLREGDEISVRCLLFGLMLESGNDAALALATHVSGSPESFARLMNAKAQQLGMENTNFVTVNGLDHANHFSSSYDLARLTGYAMNNPLFSEIVGTKQYRAVFNGGASYRTYYNSNRLLGSFEGADGVKTGFTRRARRCLVSSVTRYGVRLIAVTLNASDDWNDHKRLYEYGFSQYEQVRLRPRAKIVRVVGGRKREITARSQGADIHFHTGLHSHILEKVLLPRFVYAPVNAGDVIGHIEYSFKGNFVTRVDIVAVGSVEYVPVRQKTGLETFLGDFRRVVGIV